MDGQEELFDKAVSLLSDLGVLKDVIIAGSWCEYLYSETGVLSGYSKSINTKDVDFLIRNLRRPSTPVDLISAAKERGFKIVVDRSSGIDKLIDQNGFEVDFLLAKVGAGLETGLKTNLGVKAQTLRHLDMLKNNVMEVPWRGKLVSVPTPPAYVVHKMVVNEERKGKREKDCLAVEALLPYIKQDELEKIISRLSKKERAAVREFQENILKARQDEESAATRTPDILSLCVAGNKEALAERISMGHLTCLDIEKAVKAAVQTKALSKDSVDKAWNTLLLVRKEVGDAGHVDIDSAIKTFGQASPDEMTAEEPKKATASHENDDQDTI